jgi:hypothetical protein
MNAKLVAALLLSLFGAEKPVYFTHDITPFEAEWFGKHLSRMEEPSLLEMAKGKATAYRFTLLPTWGNPVAVRLTLEGEAGDLEVRRLDGSGGYDPGKLAEKAVAKLTAADVKEFRALVAKADFWKMPTPEPKPGMDGSEWILEGVEGGKYHLVVRWTANQYDPVKRKTADFVAVCEWMYRKSPLKEDSKNKADVDIKKAPPPKP